MDRIVLAYSGGVEAASVLAALSARERTEIVTVTLDVGQGRELESVRDRALASGAVRAHVLDVKEEFARNYILPALRAGAMEHGSGSLLGAIVRPIVARRLADVAGIEHAASIAFGRTASADERGGLGDMIRACNSQLQVIVPDAGVRRAERHQRIEQNLWGRHVQYTPVAGAPHDAFVLTRPETASPNEAATVEISFERGVPVAVNGVPMPFLELVNTLNAIAGIYGIGRTGPAECRGSHATWLEVAESPAAAVLQRAVEALRGAVASPELESFLRIVSRQYADLIHEDGWFTPLKRALDAFVDTVEGDMTGIVRIILLSGRCEVEVDEVRVVLSGLSPVAPTGNLSQAVLVTT